MAGAAWRISAGPLMWLPLVAIGTGTALVSLLLVRIPLKRRLLPASLLVMAGSLITQLAGHKIGFELFLLLFFLLPVILVAALVAAGLGIAWLVRKSRRDPNFEPFVWRNRRAASAQQDGAPDPAPADLEDHRRWRRLWWVLPLAGVAWAFLFGVGQLFGEAFCYPNCFSGAIDRVPFLSFLRFLIPFSTKDHDQTLMSGVLLVTGIGTAFLVLKLAHIRPKPRRVVPASFLVMAGAIATQVAILVPAMFGSFGAGEGDCWNGLADEADWTEPALWNDTMGLAAATLPPAGLDYAGPSPSAGANLTQVEWEGIRLESDHVVALFVDGATSQSIYDAQFGAFARLVTSADDRQIAAWTAGLAANRTAANEHVAISGMQLTELGRHLGLGRPADNSTSPRPAAWTTSAGDTRNLWWTAPPVGQWVVSAGPSNAWTFTFLLPIRTHTLPGNVTLSVDAGGRAQASVAQEAGRPTVIAEIQSALHNANITDDGVKQALLPIRAIC